MEAAMYCPKCGERAESSRFCRSCGTNLARVSNALSDGERANNRMSATRGGTTLGMFHSSKVTNKEKNLDGHSAASIFGHITIDLTGAELPEGETVIHSYSIFGSLDILVGPDVGIRVTGTSLFSEVKARGERMSNGVFSVDEYLSPGYAQAARRLRIDATSIFSAVKIKK
jgi:predicted membrane protein